MKDIQVCEFEKSYPRLTPKLQKENQKEYDIGLFFILMREAQQGYRHKRIKKPTGKGTSVRYVPIKETELPKIKDYFFKRADEINQKYGTDIKLTPTA